MRGGDAKTRLWLLALTLALAGTASAGTKVNLNGGLYPQFMADSSGTSFYLMAAEADVTAQISTKTRDLATAVLQFWASAPMPDWTMGFHFGEAYVMVPLGLRLPTIRVGQAVIPFGLLADYDTHTQIIQTQYARTIGLRLDPGIGIQGDLGKTAYALWVSNGTGPYLMDNNRNKVVTARIAPKFMLGNAEMTWGVSGLAGVLPYWPVDSMRFEKWGAWNYQMKYRAALDNTTDWGPATIRLEAVAGRDSTLAGPMVYGYYGELRYAFVDWLEAVAKYDGYHVGGQGSGVRGQGLLRNLSGGLTVYPFKTQAIDIQLVYGEDWTSTVIRNERSWNVTSQLSVRF
jgi:hypothetical protein